MSRLAVRHDQRAIDLHCDPLVIDLFAGGGGASSGIEEVGLRVDYAINHDPAATSMHRVNHPDTEHYVSDVFEVDPRLVTRGRRVGAVWFSPDCTDHSKAKGDKPLRIGSIKRRALAHVGLRWAGQVMPDVLILENVEEFQQWSRLVAKRDPATGRVMKVDGTVAAKGEYVPLQDQFLTRDRNPRRKGEKFRKFVKAFRDRGYTVEWRELRACDFGAPTIRKRLILIARRDGRPIVWPAATHFPPGHPSLQYGLGKPWRTAGECIDWSIPMLSIFASKEEAKGWGKAHGQASPVRPLAENTNKRIARGVTRYVLNNPKPFLVTLTHAGSDRVHSLDEPGKTMTCAHRGEVAVVAPLAIAASHGEGSEGGSKRWGPGCRSLKEPSPTQSCSNDTAIVGVGMVPRYGEREGQEPRVRSLEDPAATVVNTDNGGSLVAAHATKFRSRSTGYELSDPTHTVTANSNEAEHQGGSTPLGLVAANLSTYHSERSDTEVRGSDLGEPIRTQDTENRHALVASLLGQYNGGFAEGNSGDGHELSDPTSAISTKGPHQAVIGVGLATNNNSRDPLYVADEPTNTIVADGAGHTVFGAHLDQCNNGWDGRSGCPVDEPKGAVCASGSPQSLVATNMVKLKGTGTVAGCGEGVHTVNAKGQHHGVMATHMYRPKLKQLGLDLLQEVAENEATPVEA